MAGDAEADRPDTVLDDVHRVRTLAELGTVLRQLRRRHARRSKDSELTVRELAGRTGYAYGAISEYLSGKTLAPTDRFDVLIRLLGASVAEQRALATARDRVAERRRPRRAEAVPRELPPDVYAFTGRAAELAQLDTLLEGAGPGIGLISAVAGTAGVGKTALAVRWAHRVGDAFPDGCLYVDLRGYDPEQPLPPAEALGGFLRSLGVTGTDIPYGEAERAARYRTLLARRRMLIVLDNARDTDHVRPLLPGGPGCVVLVTSRDALTGLVARHGARRIGLQPLLVHEAVQLLAALIGDRVANEPAAATALADRCVRLPLALRLVAELAGTRTGATLAELDAELADIRHRLDHLDADGDQRSASRAVFSWSYRSLCPDTARAFRLLGLYPGREFDEHTVAALAGTDRDGARSLLAGLAAAHLVQPCGPGRYGMHDLLRGYAVELVAQEPARREALGRLLDHQLHTCSVSMDLVAPFDRDRRPHVPDPGWPVPQLADAAAALAWLDAERADLIATAVHATECGWPSQPGRLAAVLIRYLDTGAHYHDAELLHSRTASTGTPAEQAHALTSLGIVSWRLGRYQEAAAYQERALELARQVGDTVALGRVLTGLGIVYWHLGLVAQTLQCGEQAVQLYRETGDRIGQARVLGNLGAVYRNLGDYPAAIEHHRLALDLFRAAGDDAGIANELSNLGSAQEELGHYPDAVANLTEALEFAERAGYRECQAQALGNLGLVYRRQGRLTEALEHHRRALDLVIRIGDRAAEGYALSYLGAVHQRLNRLPEALEHHRRALDIAAEIADNHLTAEALNRMGETLLADGQPADALSSYRRALHITATTGNRYQRARAHEGIGTALAATACTSALPGTDPDADPLAHWEQALVLYADLGVPEATQLSAKLSR